MNFRILAKRLKIIGLGGASRVLSALSSVVISFVIIRTHSAALWGELIYYLLLLDVGFSIVSWGATPYLIREFSMHPQHWQLIWGRSVATRSLLLAELILTILILPIPTTMKLWLVVWAAARFAFHAFEPLARIERHFAFSLVVEMAATAIIVLPAILMDVLSLETLVVLFAVSMIIRAVVFIAFYRNHVFFASPNLHFLRAALPFLLLTFAAMLHQRMDLYCVAYFLNEKDTAVYQVFINFLIFCQFASGLLLSPYSKNIFRLPATSFLKLERQFILAGFVLSLIGIFAVWMAIRKLYQFDLSWRMYAMGYVYIFTHYLYLLRNYEMGKIYKQGLVALYSFLSSIICFGFSILLTPRLGLEGALLTGLLAQLFLVTLYHKNKLLTYAGR